MTREEAIKELSCIADEMPSMECANWIEAISMAIKALEQDYIAIPVSLIKNMCKALSEYEHSDANCFDKIHDACVDIDAFCRDKLNKSNKSEIPTGCSTCILDKTDACTRGAGRAVDEEACEDYLASPTGAESEDKE